MGRGGRERKKNGAKTKDEKEEQANSWQICQVWAFASGCSREDRGPVATAATTAAEGRVFEEKI